MKTTTLLRRDGVWTPAGPELARAQLVLVFASGQALREDAGLLSELQARAPAAEIVGCSTAGQIAGATISDEVAVATVIEFATTRVQVAVETVADSHESAGIGRRLAETLAGPELRHVLVVSEGLHVDGAALSDGLREGLPEGVTATGGLAGDGTRFAETLVVSGTAVAADKVVAIGLYGADLEVSWGSGAGWSQFGPRRRVTRSRGNVLYELDGKPALSLYKTYLGDRASGLPATGLLFPLELLSEDGNAPSVVRTILAVDEVEQSVTFAGRVPQGASVQLTKLTVERLIRAAEQAGEGEARHPSPQQAELAFIVSCVGRRLLLDQRTEEELEAMLQAVGGVRAATGFYSYGELGPRGFTRDCHLHNQTLTYTLLGERTD
ncbi:FIST signal transduction protein [Actomonas aquatica]|uniref:FIST N-terminal domain-containing protein n=1 Tax=Actomonas aquatica TaxID=2866162 RepID=A0ABZ1C592_9BACT|nr:FIST N-terminal domain-containing protein [Opitutus sp. WL0086]WRQ85689.1 FIST N-terminal domain-containing protein [Opitutus sp. WL0086]